MDQGRRLSVESRARNRQGGTGSRLTPSLRLLTGGVSAGTEGMVTASGRMMRPES